MKNLSKIVQQFLFASAFVIGTAFGDTFDYSYTFTGGEMVSGSFDGTQNGNLINGITNASVFINGSSIDTGSGIFAEGFNASHVWQNGLAQVSVDGSQNNFFFVNGNVDFGQPYTAHFLSIGNGAGNPSLMQAGDNLQGFYRYDLANLGSDNWNVTNRTGRSVPDTGSTVFLCGSAFIGLATLRRRLSA